MEGKALFVRRWFAEDEVFCCYNFTGTRIDFTGALPSGTWQKILDSESTKWKGRGEIAESVIKSDGTEIAISVYPHNLVVYKMQSVTEV